MKFYIKLLLPMVLLMLGIIKTQAQNTHTVRGKIVDAKDSTAVVGVTVAEYDRDNRIVKGVVSDVEGNFIIRMSNPNHILSFSSIGYKTKKEAVKSRTALSIFLESASSDLLEVVVTGKATSNGLMNVGERSLTQAISTIDAKAVEDMQGTSIDQMLQGRLAGMDITSSSGSPGSGIQIRIRGTNSINGTADPMIVVDGMPYETATPSDFDFASADETGFAALLNVAPSDIKNISVLKDGAATALWGARASNGVVVIETKRGLEGKPRVSYTFKGSVTKEPSPIPMLNGSQYQTLIPEMYTNRFGLPIPVNFYPEFRNDPTDVYNFLNYGQNTNWIGAITQIAGAQDHNVSINGGGAKAQYFASMGYFSQQGTTIGTGLDRLNTRINLDYKVSDRIRFKTDIAFTHSYNTRNYASSETSNRDVVRAVAYKKMPNMSIYEYSEQGLLTSNYFTPRFNSQGSFPGTFNPVALVNQASNTLTSERIIPHFQLQYAITRSNEWKGTFDVQFDISNNKTQSFLPQSATGALFTDNASNYATEADYDAFGLVTKTTINYNPKWSNRKRDFNSMWVINTSDFRNIGQTAVLPNLASAGLSDVTNDGRLVSSGVTSSPSQTRTMGALWYSSLSLSEKYIFNVGLRADGTSRFGPNNRFAFFPSISGKWNVSDEKFMNRFSSFVEYLGLRASYGMSGNSPAARYNYLYYGTYFATNFGYLGEGGVIPGNPQLENLRWEKSTDRNFGLNYVSPKRKVSIDADMYWKSTRDLIFYGLQTSSVNGYSTANLNGGTMDNIGWELNVTLNPIKTKVWNVDFNFNIAHNSNILREVSEQYPNFRGTGTVNGEYKTLLKINNPFGSFYGYKYKGVYADKAATIARGKSGEPITTPDGQGVFMRFNYPKVDYIFQPGDAMYEDINNDGNINEQDIVYLGNSNPEFTGGFGGSVSYKSLRLSGFFNYRYNYDVVNRIRMTTSNMTDLSNQSTEVLRRWHKEGDVTDVPRALWSAGYNWLGSSRYVEDASFVRLKTVTLSYTFSKSVLRRLQLSSLRAYVTAENLLTFTNYTGQNPEVQLRGSDPFRIAEDNALTPIGKTVTLGLSVTF
ncbi:MAG: SusC/RagA family TonB-linked outer membrane protein [Spirosomataceae bacterium]